MDWETSKENFRPVRGGRDADAVAKVEAPGSHSDKQNEMDASRREHLRAINDYRGDDPFKPWFRLYGSYIKWAVREFPSAAGGQRSEAFIALEECVQKFQDDPRYKEDHRFVKTWIHYADYSQDGLSVMEAMRAKEIGSSDVLSYISVATVAELKHKFKLANEMLLEGLQRLNEEGAAKLKQHQKEFAARMKQRILRKKAAEAEGGAQPVGNPSPQVHRQITRDAENIRSFGAPASHASAGWTAAPSHPTPSLGVVSQGAARSNARGGKLEVFEDSGAEAEGEASSAGSAPQSGAVFQREAERLKENMQAPAKWSEGALPASASTLPVTTGLATTEPHRDTPLLEVYEDEEEPTGSDSQAQEEPQQEAPPTSAAKKKGGLRMRLDGAPEPSSKTRDTILGLLHQQPPEVDADVTPPSGTLQGDPVGAGAHGGASSGGSGTREAGGAPSEKQLPEASASAQDEPVPNPDTATKEVLVQGPVPHLAQNAELSFEEKRYLYYLEKQKGGQEGVSYIQPEQETKQVDPIADESDVTRSFKLAVAGPLEVEQGASGKHSHSPAADAEKGEEEDVGELAGQGTDMTEVVQVSFLDPTIHTKEAMDEILGFFSNPLSCEKPPRASGSSRAQKPNGTHGSPSESSESQDSRDSRELQASGVEPAVSSAGPGSFEVYEDSAAESSVPPPARASVQDSQGRSPLGGVVMVEAAPAGQGKAAEEGSFFVYDESEEGNGAKGAEPDAGGFSVYDDSAQLDEPKKVEDGGFFVFDESAEAGAPEKGEAETEDTFFVFDESADAGKLEEADGNKGSPFFVLGDKPGEADASKGSEDAFFSLDESADMEANKETGGTGEDPLFASDGRPEGDSRGEGMSSNLTSDEPARGNVAKQSEAKDAFVVFDETAETEEHGKSGAQGGSSFSVYDDSDDAETDSFNLLADLTLDGTKQIQGLTGASTCEPPEAGAVVSDGGTSQHRGLGTGVLTGNHSSCGTG